MVAVVSSRSPVVGSVVIVMVAVVSSRSPVVVVDDSCK
jgi:hypothetical protein